MTTYGVSRFEGGRWHSTRESPYEWPCFLHAVRFQRAATPGHVETAPNGPFDRWTDARLERDRVFADPGVRRAWVETIVEGRTAGRKGPLLTRRFEPA